MSASDTSKIIRRLHHMFASLWGWATIPSKRAWWKEPIVQRVIDHYIGEPIKATKTEVLELDFDNLLIKRYVVDEVVRKCNANISRLLVLFQSVVYLDKRIL